MLQANFCSPFLAAVNSAVVNDKVIAARCCVISLSVGNSQNYFADCFNFTIAIRVVSRGLDVIDANASVGSRVCSPWFNSVRFVAVGVGVTNMILTAVLTVITLVNKIPFRSGFVFAISICVACAYIS